MPAYLETPSEVWHEIFVIATKVPDPLVCFIQDYHGSRRDVSRQPYQRYKESLAMKLALCAVSRHWNAVATPLLWQRRETKTSQLATPYPQLLVIGALLGAFVRRLDLTFSDGSEENQYYPELTGGGISQLVSKLPNLEVLGVRSSPGVSLLDTLQVLSPHLKHLHWRRGATEHDIPIPIPSLLDFLNGHPNLETFHMIYSLEEPDLGLGEISLWDRQSYPSLRHWILRQNQVDILSDVPSTVFPNLEALTFPYHPQTGNNLDRLAKFLGIHGSRLTTLRLSPYKYLKDMLSVVVRSCPLLKELHLAAYAQTSITNSRIAAASRSVVIRMPQITTLGLDSIRPLP